MMKLWICLCFLVLALSSLSRGQNASTAPHNETAHAENAEPPNPLTPTPGSPGEPKEEANGSTAPPSTPPPGQTSASTADGLPPGTVVTTHEAATITDKDTVDDSTAAQTTAGLPGGRGRAGDAAVTKTGSIATTSTSSKPVTAEPKNSSTAGCVILVVIVLVIIALCVILYFLRRVSRTYSFDLQRPAPSNHLNEPIGTFEPVYLDDLDRPAPKDQVTTDDLSPPPVANGTTPQSEEKGSNGENALQDQPDANGVETSLPSHTGSSPGDDPAGRTSSPVNVDLLLDAAEEESPQNENNNNNPSVCSSEPFVEINLDDPGWCDHFLASVDAPSSVLPFSPFSSSSSSSS